MIGEFASWQLLEAERTAAVSPRSPLSSVSI
jgi:hypothetical protein